MSAQLVHHNRGGDANADRPDQHPHGRAALPDRGGSPMTARDDLHRAIEDYLARKHPGTRWRHRSPAQAGGDLDQLRGRGRRVVPGDGLHAVGDGLTPLPAAPDDNGSGHERVP